MTTAHSGSGDLQRSLELLWHGKERPKRGPKPGLSVTEIVHAAIKLADREGINALSMRAVAAELDVGTMSLYRYIPGKGELLDLMLDYVSKIVEQPDARQDTNWRKALEFYAWDVWKMYMRHPWLLQVNQSRPVLGPNELARCDAILAPLAGSGLSSQDKIVVIATVENYVTGTARTHILYQQAVEQSGVTDEEFWEAQIPFLRTALATGAYPRVAALAENAFDIRSEYAMEFGLRYLLDGLEKFIDSKRSE